MHFNALDARLHPETCKFVSMFIIKMVELVPIAEIFLVLEFPQSQMYLRLVSSGHPRT